jgi:hypothetical protein
MISRKPPTRAAFCTASACSSQLQVFAVLPVTTQRRVRTVRSAAYAGRRRRRLWVRWDARYGKDVTRSATTLSPSRAVTRPRNRCTIRGNGVGNLCRMTSNLTPDLLTTHGSSRGCVLDGTWRRNTPKRRQDFATGARQIARRLSRPRHIEILPRWRLDLGQARGHSQECPRGRVGRSCRSGVPPMAPRAL